MIVKILHVINSLVAAGAENLVVTLANEQVKTNDVSVFTFYSEKDVFAEKLDDRIDFKPHKGQNYFSTKKIYTLYKCIKANDVIHVHLFPPFYIVAILSLFTRKKTLVFTEHNTKNSRRRSVLKPLEIFIYKRYSYIICISDGVARELKAWMGNRINSITIKNVINTDYINSIAPVDRDTLRLEDDEILLAMVGRFQEQKDQDTIIRALPALPKNYNLLLIGEGEREEELKMLSKELDVEERVHFMGVKKNVFGILKSCDVGIISSKWEGFGLVALEYMASGLPALGSNNEGLKEVIGTSEALFEIGNHTQLSKLILKTTRDTAFKKQIQETQKEHLHSFDLKKAIEEHQRVYKNKVTEC
tara:strand:- start:13586 stop:14665 length:1080 start_codon:yes stop_codon:yes gene_type:complete